MKKFILILVAAMFTYTTHMYAQGVKIGHINETELIQQMPEFKKADSVAASYEKALQDENSQMLQEYQAKLNDFDKNQKTWTEAVVEVKTQELKDLEKRIQDFQQGAQEKMSNKKQELYTPVVQKALEAVKAVGKENGYAYILDSTPNGAVLYSQPSDDITPLVKKKLGLK